MPASAFLPRGDALRHFRCVFEYDGAQFHGFQTQDSASAASSNASSLRTVQLSIEDALKRTTSEEIRVRGSSRTDKGVHARGQVVGFSSCCSVGDREFRNALNSRLPPDVLCLSLRAVEEPFDPREGCRGKTYEYLLRCGGLRPVRDRAGVWYVKKEINIAKVREAAAVLVASPVAKDYSSFAGAKLEGKDGVCALTSIEVTEHEDDEERREAKRLKPNADAAEEDEDRSTLISIRFHGDRFLYKMVRNLVGTLVDVGLGRIQPAAMTTILEAKSRKKAGQGAPPHGLTLLRVYYYDEEAVSEDAATVPKPQQ